LHSQFLAAILWMPAPEEPMPRTSFLLFAAFAALTFGFNDPADARLGGGRSFGAQRQGVAPIRPATAPAEAAGTPAAQPQAATPAAAGAPNAAPPVAPAPSPASRWLGPIAGIAAGLGLAALMSHFGLSEGFGSLLLIGLLVLGAIVLLRAVLARRQASGALQYAGASDGERTDRAAEPSQSSALQTAERGVGAAPAFGATRKPLPPGFDAQGFAKEAKRQYIQIQRSYDNGDRAALASVMTSEMNTEVGRELDGRVGHQPTEIVTLDADVLDVSEEGDKYWASVRFTGLMREDGEPLAKSVDEIWNLTKPVNGSSGWLLAGIAQLA
jgi:predicted lipid-binding transport protein (Tim44 family)